MPENHPVLGKIITSAVQRDAVHIAIAPVIANERLKPGQPIGFKTPGDPTIVTGRGTRSIGIVDPFLMEEVVAGERFYIFLYPQTITSLRHDWTHPAFDQVVPTSQLPTFIPDPALYNTVTPQRQGTPPPRRTASS